MDGLVRGDGVLSRLASHALQRGRDDSGFALFDVMIGIIVLALVSGSIALVSGTVSQAITNQAVQADRWSYVTSAVNDGLTNPATVNTTTTTTQATVGGLHVAASIVKDTSTANRTIVRAAVPRAGLYDCSNAVSGSPSAADRRACLIYEAETDTVASGQAYTPYTLAGVQAGVDGSTPATLTAGSLASWTVPAGVTTVKWVLGVRPSASGPGRITVYQGATVLTASVFDAGSADRYLYGTVTVVPGSTVTVNWEGTPGQAHHLLLYK